MYSGQYGNGFAGYVNAGEDHGGLGDTGQPLGQLFWGQMVQLKVDVILFGTATTAFTDFNGHGPRHDVSGCQVLGDGSVPLHEPLAFGVYQITALTTATY